MEFSEKLIDLVKTFEGCRLAVYLCPAGVPTVGYGHAGRSMRPGDVISKEETERLLREDLERAARLVLRDLEGVPLRQCQLEALTSMCFNMGTLSVKAPTLLKMIRNNPDDPAIRAQIMRYSNARVNGVLKQLPGLVRRRKAEAELYFSNTGEL